MSAVYTSLYSPLPSAEVELGALQVHPSKFATSTSSNNTEVAIPQATFAATVAFWKAGAGNASGNSAPPVSRKAMKLLGTNPAELVMHKALKVLGTSMEVY